MKAGKMVELKGMLLHSVSALQQEYGNGQNVRLWVASGDNEYMELTWRSLLNYRDEEQVTARQKHKSNDYSVSGVLLLSFSCRVSPIFFTCHIILR